MEKPKVLLGFADQRFGANYTHVRNGYKFNLVETFDEVKKDVDAEKYDGVIVGMKPSPTLREDVEKTRELSDFVKERGVKFIAVSTNPRLVSAARELGVPAEEVFRFKINEWLGEKK